MHRDHRRLTEEVARSRFEIEEALASCVTLISCDESGPLFLTHRGSSGICEQIDYHLIGAEVEDVVARGSNPFVPFLGRAHRDRLDDFDPERLEDNRHGHPT